MTKRFSQFLFTLIFVAATSSLIFGQRVRTFDVLHYTIRTSFDRPNKTVFGETTIRLKPLQSNFNVIELDAADLQIDAITLEKTAKLLKFEIRERKLKITLDKNYQPSDEIAVQIKHRAVKPKAGIFFVEPQADSRFKSPQIWTHGEPEEIRRWFPGYDFPDDKATSEQFITVEANEIAVANGKLQNVTTLENGKKTFHYRMRQPHVTYLTSLVVGTYAQVRDSYNGVELNYFVYPGTEAIVPTAFGKTKKMLALFEEKLKIKYPFEKYDQTVAGNYEIFYGMENITATTLADKMVYDAVNSESDRRITESVVSHEIAHSWFGNLVTCKNWSNLWLNEGFATFLEAVFIEREYGRAAYLDDLMINEFQYFADDKSLRHPLLNPRAKPNVLLFDATTYQKGAVVIHMLRETVGDDIFWRALTKYLEKYRFGVAETADLQRVFEAESGQNLDWFFAQWVRNAGYPKIEINSSYNAQRGEITLNLKQTHKSDSQTPSVFRFATEIELTVANKLQVESIEMTEREQTFTFKVAAKPTRLDFDKPQRVLDKVEINSIK